MTYKGWDIKWRVFDYSFADEGAEEERTVKICDYATEAAQFCIDNECAGVEMIAFPVNKGGVKA